MQPVLIGYVMFDTGAGTVTPIAEYGGNISRTADGDYNFDMSMNAQGAGGVNEDLCEVRYALTSGDVAGAGTARILNVIHTANSVKRLLIRSDTGALALASGVVAFYRMPPLPTP
jgi:hypothetical protein